MLKAIIPLILQTRAITTSLHFRRTFEMKMLSPTIGRVF
jgi:hypothetical protein